MWVFFWQGIRYTKSIKQTFHSKFEPMKQYVLLFLMIFASCIAIAQEEENPKQLVSIVGKVTDKSTGEILSGVTVVNQHRNSSEYSKRNGFYSIVAAEGDIIRFTSVGYKPVYMRVNKEAGSRETIMIGMEPDVNMIDSVVVSLPSLDELNDALMSVDVGTDENRTLAENNENTFNILESIEEAPGKGPVTFVSDIINNKIKKKMRKPGRKKVLPKEK